MKLLGRRSEFQRMISKMRANNSRYQSRAFLLLPMCANIGVIIGPMMGGLTSDPAGNYPSAFGGIRWLEKFPYSPPNIISAVFLFCAACFIFFGLEEVSGPI